MINLIPVNGFFVILNVGLISQWCLEDFKVGLDTITGSSLYCVGKTMFERC